MSALPQITISRGEASNFGVITKVSTLSFEQLAIFLKNPVKLHHGRLNAAEFVAASDDQQKAEKKSQWYCVAEFTKDETGEHERNKNSFAQALAVALDIEDAEGRWTQEALRAAFPDCDIIASTSYSHKLDGKATRWRVIARLSKPVTSANHYTAIQEHFAERLNCPSIKAAKDASRLHYYPGCPKDAVGLREAFSVIEGKAFDPDTVPAPERAAPASQSGETAPDDSEDTAARVKYCQTLLSRYDLGPGEGNRDAWVNAGMAVHHYTGGSVEGFNEWHEWSRSGCAGRYGGEADCRTTWDSFGKKSDGPLVTIATLEAAVRAQNPVTAEEFPYVAPAEPPSAPRSEGVRVESRDSRIIIPNSALPFDPDASRIGDVFTTEPPPPEFIVAGLYPVASGQENAAGGEGKTTRRIHEGICMILGRDVWGRRVLRPGPIVVLTKEDNAAIFRYRLRRIADAMNLTPAEKALVVRNFHVIDLSGDVGGRLVASDTGGNLHATSLIERVCRGFEKEGVVQVNFDPWNLFGPGERFVNDGEAALQAAGACISRELRCNVTYVGHVSKAVARERIIDAHSGRGGAAMGDNARFVVSYLRHGEDDERKYTPPASAVTAAARDDLFRLHVTKMSFARLDREPIWIERTGWEFKQHVGAPLTTDAKRQADSVKVLGYIGEQLAKGNKHSLRGLEDRYRDIGLERNAVRGAVNWLMDEKQLLELPLPDGERQGRRTSYLAPNPQRDQSVTPDADKPLFN